MGKNLACQRAMRLKARNIEGHGWCDKKKSYHNLLARLSFEIEMVFFNQRKVAKSIKLVRDHLYIRSAKGLSGWVQKMAIFADQYCIYADIVSGWVCKRPQMT